MPVRRVPVEIDGRTFSVGNLDKVLWPADGYTKADLMRYYLAVGPYLLPHLADRPLVFTRYPDGISGPSFYQKDIPAGAPGWVRTFPYRAATGRVLDFVLCPDRATLAWVASQACIEIHPWLSRTGTLDCPDWAVFDLDPAPPATFADALPLAFALRRVLGELGLSSVPKTTGAAGIHIYVPLAPGYTYRQVREFVRRVAMAMKRAFPARVTLERSVDKRGGHVYIDYLQNVRGKTLVAPYGVRPSPGAPVSTPVTWDELRTVDPSRFTIVTVPRRVMDRGDLFAAALAHSGWIPGELPPEAPHLPQRHPRVGAARPAYTSPRLPKRG